MLNSPGGGPLSKLRRFFQDRLFQSNKIVEESRQAPAEEESTSEIGRLVRERIAEIEKYVRENHRLSAASYFFDKNFPTLYLQNFMLRARHFGKAETFPSPPERIPVELLDRFTMGGQIPVVYDYCDSTYPSNHPAIYSDEEFGFYREMQKSDRLFGYADFDALLRKAFQKYSISGLSLLNIGFNTSWYDAFCHGYGAFVTTVDYNPIVSLSERIW